MRKFLLLSLVFSLVAALPALAQENDETPTVPSAQSFPQKKNLPTMAELEALFSQVSADPGNLELNFKYAKMAEKLGKNDEAIAAYERMLIVNPNLHRVKLDMALLYAKMGNYQQSRKLFEEVMEKNPPQTVQDNINMMLRRIRQAEKKHHVSGSVMLGFNSDSNATSTPTSGEVDLFGVSVPLDDSSQRESDDHRYGSVTLNHVYMFSGARRHNWKTSATVYKTHQSNLGNLDLTLYTVQTGPVFNVPRLRTKFGLDVGYNNTNLGRVDYMTSTSQKAYFQHFLTPKVVVNGSWMHETRRFRNSPSSTTFELRNGRAHQQDLSVNISLSQTDLLNVGLTFRQEVTKAKYNDNRQEGFSVGYTHLFPEDYFLNTTLGLKKSQYKGVDTLINPTTVRRDLERSVTLLLGKKLTDGLTATTSYQWKNIESTLQNYEYRNERVSAALSWQF